MWMVWCFDCMILHCMFDLYSEFIMEIVRFYVWSWIANIDMYWLLICVAGKSWCILKVQIGNVCSGTLQFVEIGDATSSFVLCLHRIMQNTQYVFQIKPWCWNKECIFICVFECTIFMNNMKEGWDMMFILVKLLYMEWKKNFHCFYSIYVLFTDKAKFNFV